MAPTFGELENNLHYNLKAIVEIVMSEKWRI